MIVRAKYLLGHDGTVVADGAVRIEGGRIVEVGRGGAAASDRVLDFGEALICPGLVNGHTHLELGLFAGQVAPSRDFAGWLRGLVGRMFAVGDEGAFAAAVVEGLRASLNAGTTLLGDITHRPACTRAAIAEVMPRPVVVSFGEVVAAGRLRKKADERLAAALNDSFACETLRVGVSPHSPYTVAPEILSQCGARARDRGIPLCVHAAETRAEEEFVVHGRGALRDFLREMELDDGAEAFGVSPIEHLSRLGVLGGGTLLAHCNYVSQPDIEVLSRSGASVAYCPRTHHAFGHEPHPVRQLLDAGVNVCLGTDSLASNPSLSVLEEMRFLHRHRPDVSAAEVFLMATGNGARALGWAEETGTIEVGRRADMVVLPIEPDGPNDPLRSVLAGHVGPVGVVLAGEVVHS